MEYPLIILAFLTSLVGVLGKTHDDDKPGFTGIRSLGIVVLVIGFAVLVFSIRKAFKAADADTERENKIANLQNNLTAANASLTTANSSLTTANANLTTANLKLDGQKTSIEGMLALQRDFKRIEGYLSSDVAKSRALAEQQRFNQQSASARSMRYVIDNSFCSINLGYQVFSLSLGAKTMRDMSSTQFAEYLHKQDIYQNMPAWFHPKFGNQPIYKAMDYMSERTLSDMNAQLQASALYLPKSLEDQISKIQRPFGCIICS